MVKLTITNKIEAVAPPSEKAPVQPKSEGNFDIHIGNESNIIEPVASENKKINPDDELTLYQRLDKKVSALTPVKSQDLVTIFRLLATMQNAGISLVKSLKILAKQATNVHLQQVIEECTEKVENGKSLSDALKNYPGIFSDSIVGMIAAGEASGGLSGVLLSIANDLEKSQKLARQIKGAMVYPVAIMITLFIVAIAVMVLIVPSFKDLFDQLGGELPAATQILISVSDFFVAYWIFILLSPILLYVAIRLIKSNEAGRYQWDRMMLVVPVFGDINRKVALQRFTGSLASLSAAGISITKALEINARMNNNHVYRDRILQIVYDVEQGIPIAENIKNDTFLFPDMVVSMIDVGEQTATISKISQKVSDFYEDEVNAKVKNLTTAMEPFIIVVLAVAVGGLVAAIMQPIFMLTDLAQNA